MQSPITLDMLPPELQQIIAAYQAGTVDKSRSPIPKPLTDLREPSDPKKRLHRPSFFFETGPDLPPYRHQEFPKIKWHTSGAETVVLTREAEAALGPGWANEPVVPITNPVEQARADLSGLTEAERQSVLDAHRQARIDLIRQRLSGLSETDLDALMGDLDPKAKTSGKRHSS